VTKELVERRENEEAEMSDAYTACKEPFGKPRLETFRDDERRVSKIRDSFYS
jgi:hypothetical protein